jgi:hypothetical protein
MDFDTFYNGKPLHYMGSDNIEYVATVHITWGIHQAIITRADKKHIVCKGIPKQKSYALPVGRFSAMMQYDEAIKYPVI